MKRNIFLVLLILSTLASEINGQETNEPKNLSADILTKTEDKLVFGGYGQIDFAKPFSKDKTINSTLDVSRLILSMGYNFSGKTSFFTEIEYEHVKELYVEQAFVNHSFNDYLTLRAGLLLVPMGIINEYHEPTTFNGVNRPSVDNLIIPTTWREIGFGITGRFQEPGLKYQLYMMNGFLGHDGTKGLITGEKFLRDARQKGAKAVMTSPDFSGRIDYFGIRGLKIGLSCYYGKTESGLFKNLDLTNPEMVSKADSSVVGITMGALDARYSIGALSLRGEFVMSSLSNTLQYNGLTDKNAPKAVRGMYSEIAYNMLYGTNSQYSLTAFFRFESYDTHFKVDPGITKEAKYNVNEYIFGIGFKLAEGAVLKADYQIAQPGDNSQSRKVFNAGVGVWF
ncbi:MAG: hypothetical protein IPH69_16620 [Bacteroidales bacterium]|nr:hypothetical protein [Bacteroidales bacterium]MBK7628436.1 hypothetical protein [Bacteroidales bacterium]